MQLRILLSLSIALLLTGGAAAFAQDTGSWVDPPAQVTPPDNPPQEVVPPQETVPPPVKAPEQIQVEKPSSTSAEESPKPVEPSPETALEHIDISSRAAAAEALARAYMSTWSAPSDLVLERTTEFYAPRVRYHGRMMDIHELLKEKRRFIQRWPERDYRPRLDTIKTICTHEGARCTIRSVFDFLAINSAAGRRSQGIAAFELVVSFAGERPMITAENSVVLVRGQSAADRLRSRL